MNKATKKRLELVESLIAIVEAQLALDRFDTDVATNAAVARHTYEFLIMLRRERKVLQDLLKITEGQ